MTATKTETKSKTESVPSPFKAALPAGLSVGRDRLRLRLDFYGEAIVMQDIDNKREGGFRMVAAHDIAHALAAELSFGTGLLPENTLWWSNSRGGPLYALWVPPGVRRLAISRDALKAPDRYNVPLPGLIFICRPAQPPAVYAAARRPAGLKERVYKAPFPNVHDDGSSCSGSHRYPALVADIPDSFFRSFFSHEVTRYRSKKYPDDVTRMWKELDKAKATEWPLSDLQYHGTVNDLMQVRL